MSQHFAILARPLANVAGVEQLVVISPVESAKGIYLLRSQVVTNRHFKAETSCFVTQKAMD
ncbi:uncharacterized protein METZ01_LOCUS251775, partial [marine metagenome]